MMISPEAYIEVFKDATYTELINERKRLIKSITAYEKNEMSDKRTDKKRQVCPSPEVKYQCYLEYLAILCTYMRKKYSEDDVWSEKELSKEKENEH